jgi:hypothetical protein
MLMIVSSALYWLAIATYLQCLGDGIIETLLTGVASHALQCLAPAADAAGALIGSLLCHRDWFSFVYLATVY